MTTPQARCQLVALARGEAPHLQVSSTLPCSSPSPLHTPPPLLCLRPTDHLRQGACLHLQHAGHHLDLLPSTLPPDQAPLTLHLASPLRCTSPCPPCTYTCTPTLHLPLHGHLHLHLHTSPQPQGGTQAAGGVGGAPAGLGVEGGVRGAGGLLHVGGGGGGHLPPPPGQGGTPLPTPS